MPAQLVSLEKAKRHLRMDHDADDEMILDITYQASAVVLNYLKDTGNDQFMDSSGDMIAGVDVPWEVQAATLIMVGVLYRNPTGEGGTINPAFSHGMLPDPVTALLYPLRDPALR